MFRYFGPPGTGKTTTLLNKVESLLSKGVSPNDIGYFAFTRKAAHEARDRAVTRFNLDPENDFIYFRTLHSLAFQALGMANAQILGPRQLKEFGKKAGIDFTAEGVELTEDEGFAVMRSNHPVMRGIDLARNSLKGPQYAYNEIGLTITYYEFNHHYKEYERFKEQNGLKDFTDMIQELANNPSLTPRLKVVFLDEAQDLTPLQWLVSHSLEDYSDRMFVAGDDDQGIYRWAGADIGKFISLPGASEVLSQSYRIPRSVHDLANRVVGRIRHRQKKIWSPRTEEGIVERVPSADAVDFSGGEWLVMSQANYMLDELAEHMKSAGHYFERKGTPSIPKKVKNAIQSWNHLLENPHHEVSQKEAINLYDHISSGEGKIRRGAKKILAGSDEQDLFSLSVLHQNFGLETIEGGWETALDRISDENRAYCTALLNRGVNIFEKPRIRLSTIHGAKGGEADNVLLYLDLTGRALRHMHEQPDDTHRQMYVGITRARNRLVLKLPDNSQNGYPI
jgi:DNA helicase-2/ATP-dependent DNA helicase PcrA